MALADITKQLWNGSISVRVSFQHQSQTLQYLFLCPRKSYIALFFDRIVNYFSIYNERLAHDPIWLEYEDIPLKWNIPIGLLYDFLYLPKRLESDFGGVFEVRLKSGEYPSQTIMHFIYKKEDNVDYTRSVNEAVFNQLKQSTFVLNGNSKPMFNLSKDDSFEFWESIQYHNFEAYTRINRKVIPRKLHRLPVRILVPGTTTVLQPVIEEVDSILLLQLVQEHLPRVNVGLLYVEGISCNQLGDVLVRDLWSTFRNVDNFLYFVVILQ